MNENAFNHIYKNFGCACRVAFNSKELSEFKNYLTCASKDLIYVIECKKCHKDYVE